VAAELGADAAAALARALELPSAAPPQVEQPADDPLPPASVEGTDTIN